MTVNRYKWFEVHDFFQEKFFSWKIAVNPWRINIAFEKGSLSVLYLKNAWERVLDLPSPVGNGWVITDGDLRPEYTILGGVSSNTLELVSCWSQKGYKRLILYAEMHLYVTKVKIAKSVDFSNGNDSGDE